MHKHWFSFMLWGRLGYDPSLSNSVLEKEVACRFPGVPAPELLEAWAAASMIIPLVNAFHWEDFDFQWYPEACTSNATYYKGFHTVRHFIDVDPMPESGMTGVRAYCEEPSQKGKTPLWVGERLMEHAATALRRVADLGRDHPKELRLTLGDIEATAHLGNYYARKIRGATTLCLFESYGDTAQQVSSVEHLRNAAEHWRSYASVIENQYRPQVLTRIGIEPVNVRALERDVLRDIDIAASATHDVC